MPLTLGIIAGLAHLMFDLPWIEALLMGAALSPTDPVLAAAIVGREEVPARLRHLLNVESGLNDGLALPVVIATLAVASENRVPLPQLLLQIGGGVAIGVVVPWLAIRLGRLRIFGVAGLYEPLGAFAIGTIVFALAGLLGYNMFLAAFAAGVTIATLSTAVRDAFRRFGELVTELLKLGALFLFGALIPISAVGGVGWLLAVGFALLVLLVARPAALAVSLLGSQLDVSERVTAAWFGPKGFASVAYGLIILHGGISHGSLLFDVIALVTAISIVAHSSTDVLVARWFRRLREEGTGGEASGDAVGQARAEAEAEREVGEQPEIEHPAERGEEPEPAEAEETAEQEAARARGDQAGSEQPPDRAGSGEQR
jgi:NhaP-type Na+/H+ or K+/H+ antiporter